MLENIGTASDKHSRLRFLELQKRKIQLRKRKLELLGNQTQIRKEESFLEQQTRAFVEAYPFHEFVKEGFAQLEQGREFKDNWHISIICEALQATVLREVRYLIINIPRRTMKSLLSCVLFPAWVWTFSQSTRFLYTSYSAEFAGRDNQKTLNLIDSDWYQNTFGHLFNVKQRQEKKKITNDKGGFRVVFKIGKGTGEGGDFVIADDPNAIDEVESDIILEKTNNGWNEISSHNVTDRSTAVRIIIQQRTTTNDLTGNITEDDELRQLYSVLCLAMEFESDNPLANTLKNPLSLGFVSNHEASSNPNLVVGEEKLWIDPRSLDAPDFQNLWYQEWYKTNFTDKGLVSQGEGQLLWETYLTKEIVQKDIAHLKAHGAHSQFQQRPIRRGGNFFNSKHFEEVPFHKLPLTEGLIFCRVWDKAGTDGAGDWTIGMLIARTKKRPYTFYIVDMFFDRIAYKERMDKMKELAELDYKQYVEPFEEQDEFNEYRILIEKEGNSSGSDISGIEREELTDYEVYFVNPRKKKAVRAKPAKLISEQGRIKVIQSLIWNNRFFRDLEKFDPNKERQKDDVIDTLAHGINHLRGSNTSDSKATDGVI